MKRLYIIFIFIWMPLIAGADGNNDIDLKEPKIKYRDYVKRIKAGDTTINYFYFRIAYAKSKDYDPTNTNIVRYLSNMYESAKDTSFKEAGLMADKILKKNYAHIGAHLVAAWARGKAGDSLGQQFHRKVAKNLIQSILATGDGKSMKSAYLVINVSEENDLLNYLGLKCISQSLYNEGESHFDVLEVVDSEMKDTTVIYFNVDIPFQGYSKKLHQIGLYRPNPPPGPPLEGIRRLRSIIFIDKFQKQIIFSRTT